MGVLPWPVQNMDMGATTGQSAVMMMSWPGALSLLVEVGHTVDRLELQPAPVQLLRQLVTGLQVMVCAVSPAGISETFILEELTPAALFAITPAICWTVTEQLLLPDVQVLP